MLYNIVNQYDVECFFQLYDLKNIRGYESCGQSFLMEELAGMPDAVIG